VVWTRLLTLTITREFGTPGGGREPADDLEITTPRAGDDTTVELAGPGLSSPIRPDDIPLDPEGHEDFDDYGADGDGGAADDYDIDVDHPAEDMDENMGDFQDGVADGGFEAINENSDDSRNGVGDGDMGTHTQIEEHGQDVDVDTSDAEELMDNLPDEPEAGLTTMVDATVEAPAGKGRRKNNKLRSVYGIEYPCLPKNMIKKHAEKAARNSGIHTKLTPDVLEAITTASNWFFEQVGEDLRSYATHAGRKTINENDMITLMKRYEIWFAM
jgi:histone H3/H4